MAATQELMLGEGAGSSGPANYIEDVFSTYLYTGTGATLSITNNIDLSTKGGMVWIKSRSTADPAGIFDTARGATNSLRPSGTNANLALSGVTSFDTTGFTLGSYPYFNGSGQSQVAWTFRKQPKFFDVVTYTGNGSARTIAHNLGSAPGCIIIKNTSSAALWAVYHRSTGANFYSVLNTTAAASEDAAVWNNTSPTSTEFSLGNNWIETNQSGQTYVAYIFAHDAGGFGLTGTDNVISCGSYTGTGAAGNAITLGYEPQWFLIKHSSGADSWFLVDNIRGAGYVGSSVSNLYANLANAESLSSASAVPTATGFVMQDTSNAINGLGETYIYIAIRKGPMKVPTDATKVFQPVAYTGTNVDNRLVNSGIVTDMTMARIRSTTSTGGFYTADRLRANAFLGTAATSAETTDADSFMTPTSGYGNSFSAMNGFGVGNDVTRQLNQSSTNQLAYAFKRAPGFFDEVCYTGTGSSAAITHNLGVAPELSIIKSRSLGVEHWNVWQKDLGIHSPGYYYYLQLDATTAKQNSNDRVSTVTSTVVNIGNNDEVNKLSSTYVMYLFATCAGVSKVGSYTGTGATQTISCGFTGGARFVFIKRTDSTGDWYVWDTARGMVAGTDPYLVFNKTPAESNANDIYTTAVGFQIVSTADDINASGGTYIFLAIA